MGPAAARSPHPHYIQPRLTDDAHTHRREANQTHGQDQRRPSARRRIPAASGAGASVGEGDEDAGRRSPGSMP